jgi:rhomboid protease GluP
MSNLPPEHEFKVPSGYSVVGIPEPPQQRASDFVRLLYELTPRTYVTPILIGINAVVFVMMLIFGVSPISPTTADLLRWGADFGPLTIGGEWWRLVTSMFLHIGLIHIGFNMWVLYAAGPLVERMVGNVGFLLMYLVAGLCGGLASLSWNPLIVSAGASGAIFGIYGCLLGLVVRGKGSIPPQILVQLRSSGMGFLFYNLIFGMAIPNIDMAAHLGGLAGGFFCGLVLSQPFTEAARSGRLWRNVLLIFLGACVVTAGFFGVSAWYSTRVKRERELKAMSPPTQNQVVPSTPIFDMIVFHRSPKKQLRADFLAKACPALFGGRDCRSGMPAGLAAASCCRPMVELYENRRGV